MNSRNLVIAAVGFAVALSGVSAASAETRWERHHPRREQVNDRLAHQDARIHRERAEGDISAAKAHRLHAADHRIRMAERRDARMHGGHITAAEQARLNARENAVSARIGR